MKEPRHGEFWFVVIVKNRMTLFTVALFQNFGDQFGAMVIGKEDMILWPHEKVKLIRRIPVPRILTRHMKKEPRK